MHGYIDEYFNTMLEDIAVVGKGGNLQLEAVLDTGFNGMFSLPKKHFHECVLSYYGTEEYILANGAVVEEPVYRGRLVIDNRIFEVIMCVSNDDEALLGTRLLNGKIVTLDFINY
ncbi:MAG: hypothetical protein AAB354_16315, partial [candidate division KSB1 bacterium]